MLKTILIIITSVSIFGLVTFVIVKNIMKKRIEYYLKLNEKKRKLNKLNKFIKLFLRHI